MTTAQARRDVRFHALHRFYKQKHAGKAPETKFDKYVLDCIINLGEIYDENQDEIRALLHKGFDSRHPKLLAVRGREDKLNNIGQLLRDLISLNIPNEVEVLNEPERTPDAAQTDYRTLLQHMQRQE